MPAEWTDFPSAVPPAFYAPVIAVLWLLALWLAKRIVLRRLRRWASRTTVDWDDLLVDALSFPLNFLILASGLTVLSHLLPLPPKADRVATVALQASVIFAIVSFADALVRGYMARNARAVFGNVSQGVLKGLVRAFVIGIGALIFLDLLGISITPILASLGIGSLAVALALQDTLGNFFAGIYITIDKPVMPGDYVKLDLGVEGYVVDVGWRSTRIRQLANNIVVVPNSKLMSSTITNFYLPEKEMGFTLDLGVHYDSDLALVEKVVVEVAAEVQRTVQGAVREFKPFMRFHTFADSSVNFSVILRANEFTDNFLMKHEFVKALHKRFKTEGIVIPYPMRTLVLDRGAAEKLSNAAHDAPSR